MIIKRILLVFLLFFPLFSYATTFEVDYDGDGINDIITEENVSDHLKLTITLSSVDNTKFEYVIERYDNQIMPRSHKSFTLGEIEIDSSYPSQGGAVYSQIYQWDVNKKNWNLVKIIDGEKENYTDGEYIPKLNITRVQCCYHLGDNSFKFEQISENDVNNEISKELEFLKLIFNLKNNNEIMKRINIYSATEYAKRLNINNVELLNNIANFIREPDWQSSAIILQRIVEKFPERIEAVLNLADSYWDSDEPIIKKNAVLLYKKYEKTILSNKVSQTIPDYVSQRIKTNLDENK